MIMSREVEDAAKVVTGGSKHAGWRHTHPTDFMRDQQSVCILVTLVTEGSGESDVS